MDHSQAMSGGCQSSNCPATACAYWDWLSGPDSPGNQMARLAPATIAAVMAIETDVVVAEPTWGMARMDVSMSGAQSWWKRLSDQTFKQYPIKMTSVCEG